MFVNERMPRVEVRGGPHTHRHAHTRAHTPPSASRARPGRQPCPRFVRASLAPVPLSAGDTKITLRWLQNLPHLVVQAVIAFYFPVSSPPPPLGLAYSRRPPPPVATP